MYLLCDDLEVQFHQTLCQILKHWNTSTINVASTQCWVGPNDFRLEFKSDYYQVEMEVETQENKQN